jgi:glycosyltransferase involved in cell wall biosynthesis
VLGGKAKYVSLGVDTDEFRPVYDHKERELLHGAIIPDSVRMTIGWVHRNIMRKRLSDMMIAFQKFTERKAGREKEVAFLLHTDPSDPEGSDVRELKSRLVGRDRCFFLSPSMGQDPRYLNLLFDKMDVHVDISWNEGFGCTVAESMSAGVPNIVVASAELPHLVGDTGWVLPPTVSHSVANRTYPPLNTQILIDFDILGVDPLVDTLERLFENMGDVRSRREAARQRILDHFSIEDTAKKMEKELEEAVGSVEPLPDYKCVVV